jgi:hypothetical protein
LNSTQRFDNLRRGRRTSIPDCVNPWGYLDQKIGGAELSVNGFDNPGGEHHSCYGEPVTILFFDELLYQACYNERAGIRRWGKDPAAVIRRRISQIISARTLADLARMGPLSLRSGPESDQIHIDGSAPQRIVLLPYHDPMPRDGDGQLVYADVTHVCILDICELHGR